MKTIIKGELESSKFKFVRKKPKNRLIKKFKRFFLKKMKTKDDQ